MKIKAVFGGVLLVLFSMFFISNANAGECSVEDPCQTYAVVSGNTVTNIIVCQPSVCGSGFFAGQKVVPQVAADTDGQNRGGYWGLESNGVFTTQNSPSINTVVETINNTEVTVTMEGAIQHTSTFADTVNKPASEWFTPVLLPDNTKVTVSADKESLEFNERVTKEEFDLTIWLSEFELLFKNINFFGVILSSWNWFF
ncbi:hypothetical protein UFOVP694_154 [uncultured Caudovirales phage]|uniref:Uncharacterized protein n=1 Tax=uncultured Caudovirales phage TaxID=2100421 RepID=A0A6J5NK35_9CAUD|nr:hypothetical protein UFOVP694_154 [uncultured Caudovirales phage]